MSNARRLLELNAEFQVRLSNEEAYGCDFPVAGRSLDEIAEEYESALREFAH